MRLLFSKADWELAHLPLEAFIERAAAAGYDATEIYLPARPDPAEKVRALHEAAGLRAIAHIATDGRSVGDHLESLRERYRRAVETEPLFVNSHTGRDHFDFHDNLRIFEEGEKLAETFGVPLVHETHRGRALFCAPVTRSFLRAMPSLKLTADFSHWVCVHESDLSDQPANLRAAMDAAFHIHARVGFDEGPQISDPRNPAHAPWLERFTGWWLAIIASRKAEGREWMTISPEFGPAPYMPLNGASPQPVADAWEVNLWMTRHLRERIGSISRST